MRDLGRIVFARGVPVRADCGPDHASEMTMTDVGTHVIKFQCPKCGHELEQSIGELKSMEHMRCRACGVGINIDTNRLASAAEEMQKAIEKVPPEITIKFFR
jgi:transcription elongation factor Elf1